MDQATFEANKEIIKSKLGRVPTVDPRNHGFRLDLSNQMNLAQVGHKYWPNFADILDQGDQPHCVGYAGFKWLQMNPVQNSARGLSPDWLYFEAKRNDEWDGENYDGTSALGLMKVLKREGYVSEYRWIYDTINLVTAVLNHGPVLMGTSWYQGMITPDLNGYIKPEGYDYGGHEYVIAGVNTESKNPDGTKGKAQIINSWGPGWGNNGRAWITLDNLTKLLKNQGDCVTALEINKD